MKYYFLLIALAVIDLILQACLLTFLGSGAVSNSRLLFWSNVLLLHFVYVPVVFVAGIIAALHQKWASTVILVACATGSYLICSWWAGGGWWSMTQRG